MKIDANDLDLSRLLKADVCIIGAGAAGITLAREFLGTDKTVYLLEAGGYEYSEADQEYYTAEETVFNPSQLFDQNYTQWSRVRFFGGSTNYWGGWSRPLESFDFEARPWIPQSGWPFSRQELIPYYHRASDIIEIPRYDFDNESESPLARKSPSYDKLFADAAKNPEIRERFFSYSPPTNFGQVYAEELHNAPNVFVVTNASVTRLDCTTNGDRISQIEFVNKNFQKFLMQSEIFVLACGGLENPRMLLNSDHQYQNGLGNQHDLVGRCFMEHPHSTFAWLLNNQGKEWSQSFDAMGFNEVRRIFMTDPQFQEKLGLMNYSCEVTLMKANLSNTPEILELCKVSQTTSQDPLQLRLYVRSEMAPRASNRVQLGRQRDPLGLRRMKLSLEYGPDDLATVRKSTQAVMRHLSFLKLGRAQFVNADPLSWTPDTSGACHHMGTTRMSDNPKEGVVDSQCRVHGLQNLVVAGASVFPTGGFANPTMTLVALALRTADAIKAGSIR